MPMNVRTGYVLIARGLTAGLRVVRGAVRAAVRALAGDARGALAEAAGGLIAPAAQVYGAARLLVADALDAAQPLAEAGELQMPRAAFAPQGAQAGRRNGVAGRS
jgi:hypothetical protein